MRALTLCLALLAGSLAAEEPHLRDGAVVAPEPLAAAVGARVLERGGNAADATVAVHFALAVTFPNAGNLGGGGFILAHVPDATPSILALDFRERAPGAAHPALYQDESGEVIEGLSLWSHLAAGVPGSVLGMWRLHEEHGSLPWAELLAPAIELAQEGFELDDWTARSFASTAKRLAGQPEHYREHLDFAKTFRGDAGEVFRQPELAATLRRIAEQGPSGFYGGKTAELIVAEMKRGGGIVTLDDLMDYEVKWRKPVAGTYRGHRVFSMPPPSSGGIALVQHLQMLEFLGDVPAMHSTAHVHRVAEISKRVFADRAHFLGDSDFTPVPVEELVASEYCRKRAKPIRADVRTDPASIERGNLSDAIDESEETTHYSIVDAAGMAISCTTTLNYSYGSGIVVDGAGFLLNNEMDDFSAKPGVPNLYGVTGGEANKVEGGKRMLSSMSPTLVLTEEGRLRFVLGSPGGPTIFTSVFQVLVNRLDFELPLQEAVDRTRFHHQWPPRGEDDVIFVDGEWGDEVVQELRELGYTIQKRRPLGDVQAIEILEDGAVVGAPDRRGRGAAAVVKAEEPVGAGEGK